MVENNFSVPWIDVVDVVDVVDVANLDFATPDVLELQENIYNAVFYKF